MVLNAREVACLENAHASTSACLSDMTLWKVQPCVLLVQDYTDLPTLHGSA